ncbi:alpha/beta hydrolase-like protein [Leptotrombidium deliense]|uniref:palmitoyl-protein hydrolase n=1 Tax=Leptotrombidium deliense TaxID=299467 RepID=A0A443S7X3_9ACAR|nr:alpha/beta hydrolase-like protein [Leptotrombidium deliense]
MSKVGVGSYSEVYSAINDNREKLVYKIIPVENKSGTNKISQKSKSALSDLIITKTLNSLRSGSFEQASHYCENFTNLRGLNYVTSEVDRLQCDGNAQKENYRRKSSYKYLICEMADDGITLHNKKSLTPKEGIAICAQILAAFSVAESAVQFEHRDFHTNNILLTLTETPSLKYKLNNHTFEIPVYKWKVTIIDFTFSRLTVGKEDTPIYTDLQKLKISGLKNSSLFRVYDLQRKALKGNWDHYNPKTNIYWVEFVVKEVLKRVDNYWSSVGVHSKCITSDFYQMLQSWKDTISGVDARSAATGGVESMSKKASSGSEENSKPASVATTTTNSNCSSSTTSNSSNQIGGTTRSPEPPKKMNGLSLSELCCLFCCPPCPGRIAAKLAFLPPEATYTLIPGDASNHSLSLTDRAEWQYSQRDLEMIEVFYTRTSRGNRIACMYVRASSNPRFTVLFSHGNAVDLGQMSSFYLGLGTRINCNIFSYDYSGYGCSTGKPSEKNLYADIDSAWHALRSRYGISPEHIILYGQSIGTVPTVDLASRFEVGAVILHSPLMSGMRVAFPNTKRTWFFDAFPSIDKVPKVTSPVLVIHGTEDEVIDFSHGLAIYERCPKAVEPLWVEGAGHNDVELYGVYLDRLKQFITVDLAN